MPILILGGTGMLGHKLAQTLGADAGFEVHATVRALPAPAFRFPAVTYHEGVDVSPGSAALPEVVRRLAPDVIVNAVGAIKQKDLSAHVVDTLFVNGTLPHVLGFLNPNPRGRVVHFSTDCVFVGDRGGYTESHAPDALDLYGRSKACGELTYPPHLTLRTSIVGFEIAGHLSLLSWLFRQPRGSRLRGFSNAVFSGLPTATLSRTVAGLLKGGAPPTGLHHVASEPIDKFDLLTRLNSAFGLGLDIERDPEFRIDRSLDDAAFRRETGTTTPGWDALIAELREDYRSLPYAALYAELRGERENQRAE